MQSNDINSVDNKSFIPFYAVPNTRKTSAEIINEAREAVGLGIGLPINKSTINRVNMKAVSTKRPFTPRDKQRTLFGPISNKQDKHIRPKSSGLSLHVEEEEFSEMAPSSASGGAGSTSPPWGVRLPSLSSPSSVEQIKPSDKNKTKLNKSPITLCKSEKLDLGVVGYSLGKKPSASIKNPPQCTSVNPQPLSIQALTTSYGTTNKQQPELEINRFEEVISLINVLKIIAKDANGAPEIEKTLHKLYIASDNANMLGRKRDSHTVQSASIRSQLLRTLFLLVEREEHRVLLQLARILLALQVLGPNLSAVCKLLFKVSRSDQNDKLFLEDNILELLLERLGGASLVEDAEACVYGYGALKFVTMEPCVVTRVLELGGLELMVLHMKLINLMAQEGGGKIPDPALQALFQLTGALRHVAGEISALQSFVTTGALTQICRSLQLFSHDPDLMSNIARTISISSTHEGCCDSLVAQPGCLRACVSLLERFPQKQDLVVRLSYALGNIMARSEHARSQLLGDIESRASILSVLTKCWDQDQNSQDFHTSEDVLVKVLRVVANASLSESVGPTLANSNELLNSIEGILNRKNCKNSEELILGALLTLNNLTFYPNNQQSALAVKQIQLATGLIPLLNEDQLEEVRIETMRVFGNLTRWKETRDYLLNQNVGAVLISLLNDKNLEMVYVSCGVLVNFLADPEARNNLSDLGVIPKLIEILETQLSKGDNGDWELAALVSQALWNCCANDAREIFEPNQMENLITLLADLLDEERLFGIAENTTIPNALAESTNYQLWEEFASVTTNLLERLETYMETSSQQ